ncbi:MAG: hypothetical protein K6E62_06255 [Lachnospiraceae bacterium]|nr:hypothetical protein [Lachnospiraceae bacterium]
MKKFNFSKGLVIGLLTLALVLTGFATVKASAADETKTITFKAKVGDDVTDAEYKVTFTPGKAAVEDDPSTDANEAAAAVDPVVKTGSLKLDTIIAALAKADSTLYIASGTPTSNPEGKVTYSDAGEKFEIDATVAEDIVVTIPVKIPSVTFTVTVNDILKADTEDDESGTYKFTTDGTFLKKGNSITIANIIAGMKLEDGDELTETGLQDPTAWVLNAFATTGVNATNKDYISQALDKITDKITLAENLDKLDVAFTFTVTNSKAPVTFVYGDYKAYFEVDNKKADTKILFSDIVDKLQKTEGEGDAAVVKTYVGEEGESVILAEGLTAANVTAKGNYSTWYYTVKRAGTAASAETDVTITDKKVVSAFKWAGYDPETDSIVFDSPVELTLYWVDCKSSKGVQVKGDKVNSLSLTKVTPKGGDAYYTASIPLYDKSAGVKVAESKAAYIYASVRTPSEDKAKYAANYIVDATPYKKISVTFAYAQAAKDGEEPAIASITTIDNKKKTVIYSGEGTEAKEFKDALEEMIDDLQYSEDGTTWYYIIGNEMDPKTKKAPDLNLNKLYELVNGGSKTTLYFRIKGAEAEPETPAVEGESEGSPAKNAYRATKAVKVSVDAAKEGKAVKVDVSKGTLALKNGYDFTITSKNEEKNISIEEAFTILPFNKGGKAKEIIVDEETHERTEGDDTAIWPTYDYVPAGKVTENAKMFTNIKVKAFSVKEICDYCDAIYAGTGDLYIWIRKSATAKKPAEKWTLMTIARVTDGPTIKEDKNKFYSVQDVADTKGVIATPEISNAKTDKNSGAYEYLVVDAADIKQKEGESKYYADIDFTTAKWTTLGDKGLTVGKSKSKYSAKTGGKATDHVLKDGSIVLVRRAGDKSSNILASEYIITMVAKESIEVEVEKDDKKVKESKTLYVWKSYSVAAE